MADKGHYLRCVIGRETYFSNPDKTRLAQATPIGFALYEVQARSRSGWLYAHKGVVGEIETAKRWLDGEEVKIAIVYPLEMPDTTALWKADGLKDWVDGLKDD